MRNRCNFSKLLEVMFVRELSSRLPVSTLIAVSAVNLSFPLNAFHRNKQPPFIRSGVATMKTSLTPRKCGVKYLSTLLLARVRARDMASCCEPKEQSHYVISMEERDFQTPVVGEIDVLSKVGSRVQRIVDELVLIERAMHWC